MGVTLNSDNNKKADMDAIKKKMQAMKVEKDNAMDRSDVCEQAAKDAKVRAAKAEEEVAELVKKAQQLEVELDKTQEELLTTTEKLKDKENSLSAAELEVNSLNRRVQSLGGDLETCEDKLLLATQKLDKAATAGDDSDRMRKVLEARAVQDEERMGKLEEELKNARNQAEEADKQYEEVQKRLQQVESELERDEDYRVGGGIEGCRHQPQVSRGLRGQGQPERGQLQGADQDSHCQAEAG